MKSNKTFIKQSIKFAQECVEEMTDLEKEFRIVAFQTTLEYIIGSKITIPATIETKSEVADSPVRPQEIMGVKTFASFLRRLNAKSHSDKTLAIAYFLLKTKNKMAFTKEDIEKEYQGSFLRKSKNTNAEINGLIQRGNLMPNDKKVDGKRTFTITLDGISFIEESLMKKNEK